MKIQFALYFLILATIQLGLLIGIYHYTQSQNLPINSKYWTSSLSASVIGLFLFGFGILFIEDIAKPGFSFTIANTFFYSASLLQMLFCKSLNSDISKRIKYFSIASVVIFIPTFEFLRIRFDFETRTLFMCTLVSCLYLSQIHQLITYQKTERLKQIRYLLIATIIEMALALCRFLIIVFPQLTIHQIEQIPAILTVVTLFQLVMNTLSYIAIGGFWTEKISITHYQIETENAKIKKLLDEQNKLIHNLSVVNKTAATGALAASIAHELNQPLGSSNINIQLLKLKIDRNEISPQFLNEIVTALQNDNTRASTIIQSLRSIFIEERLEFYSTNIQSIVDDVLVIITPELKKFNIQLELPKAEPYFVKCVPSQIKQVFINLLNNSIESLSKSNHEFKLIKLSITKSDSHIGVDFYDNGPGVPEESQEELFELLSSSKKSGMGLGLWLSKHILTRHAGTLIFENGSEGAHFKMTIPATP